MIKNCIPDNKDFSETFSMTPEFFSDFADYCKKYYLDYSCSGSLSDFIDLVNWYKQEDKDLLKYSCYIERKDNQGVDCNLDVAKYIQNNKLPSFDDRWNDDFISRLNSWISAASSKGNLDSKTIYDVVSNAPVYGKIYNCLVNEGQSKFPLISGEWIEKIAGCKYPYNSTYLENLGIDSNQLVYLTKSVDANGCAFWQSCGNGSCGEKLIPVKCLNAACMNDVFDKSYIGVESCGGGHKAQCLQKDCGYLKNSCNIGSIQGEVAGFLKSDNSNADGLDNIDVLCQYNANDIVKDDDSMMDLWKTIGNNDDEMKYRIWHDIFSNYCIKNVYSNLKNCDFRFTTDADGDQLCIPLQASDSPCQKWFQYLTTYRDKEIKSSMIAPYQNAVLSFCRDPNGFNDDKFSPPAYLSDQCKCINATIDPNNDNDPNYKYKNSLSDVVDAYSMTGYPTAIPECWLGPCIPQGLYGPVLLTL